MGFDRIFKNLGLSQSLMVQKGVPNHNVTLKGYPKKFWGLFCQKPHKTQQTISPQRGDLPLTDVDNLQGVPPTGGEGETMGTP